MTLRQTGKGATKIKAKNMLEEVWFCSCADAGWWGTQHEQHSTWACLWEMYCHRFKQRWQFSFVVSRELIFPSSPWAMDPPAVFNQEWPLLRDHLLGLMLKPLSRTVVVTGIRSSSSVTWIFFQALPVLAAQPGDRFATTRREEGWKVGMCLTWLLEGEQVFSAAYDTLQLWVQNEILGIKIQRKQAHLSVAETLKSGLFSFMLWLLHLPMTRATYSDSNSSFHICLPNILLSVSLLLSHISRSPSPVGSTPISHLLLSPSLPHFPAPTQAPWLAGHRQCGRFGDSRSAREYSFAIT